jgi:hypothetical protein
VCQVFLSAGYKYSRSSPGARRELHEVVSGEVFLFLCVGNFGFTRPIQDYDSGPGIRYGGQVSSSILVGLAGQKQL